MSYMRGTAAGVLEEKALAMSLLERYAKTTENKMPTPPALKTPVITAPLIPDTKSTKLLDIPPSTPTPIIAPDPVTPANPVTVTDVEGPPDPNVLKETPVVVEHISQPDKPPAVVASPLPQEDKKASDPSSVDPAASKVSDILDELRNIRTDMATLQAVMLKEVKSCRRDVRQVQEEVKLAKEDMKQVKETCSQILGLGGIVRIMVSQGPHSQKPGIDMCASRSHVSYA